MCERCAQASGGKLSLTKLRSWPKLRYYHSTAEKNSQLLSLVQMLSELLLHWRELEVRGDVLAASYSPTLTNRKA